MKDFWIENGWYFFQFGGLLLFICIFSIHYYTGNTKRLDLIVEDILKFGEVRKEVIEFDKFFNDNGLDPLRLSTFTHIFYIIPSKKKHSELYENYYFNEQVDYIKNIWFVYKVAFILIFFDATFIGIMTYLFGDNIK